MLCESDLEVAVTQRPGHVKNRLVVPSMFRRTRQERGFEKWGDRIAPGTHGPGVVGREGRPTIPLPA